MLVSVFYKKRYVGCANVSKGPMAKMEALFEVEPLNEYGLPMWDPDEVTIFPNVVTA